MSYDRLLEHVCPHMVVEEPLYLSTTRQVVRPLRPIAAAATVRVRVNGEVEAPSSGVHIPAQATGSKSGPFTINNGINDRLVLSVGDSSPQTLVLPSGRDLPISKIADVLNRSSTGLACLATPKRQLRFNTYVTGPSATLFLHAAGSTAAQTLGLPVGRNWRGQTIIPGWSLISDPNTLDDRPTRLIVFDRPLKGYTDYVEVNYATIRQECRRCGGLGLEHDWRYDASGALIKVKDHALLLQEVMKITYTVLGSNRFHPWFGTTVVSSIGKKQSSSGIMQNMILSEVTDAFRRWQTIKRQQEEVVGQLVSDEEYPFRLSVVNMQQSSYDPTIVIVSASVQSRSRKTVDIVRGVKVPMPIDLLGSTQQKELFDQTIPTYQLIENI